MREARASNQGSIAYIPASAGIRAKKRMTEWKASMPIRPLSKVIAATRKYILDSKPAPPNTLTAYRVAPAKRLTQAALRAKAVRRIHARLGWQPLANSHTRAAAKQAARNTPATTKKLTKLNHREDTVESILVLRRNPNISIKMITAACKEPQYVEFVYSSVKPNLRWAVLWLRVILFAVLIAELYPTQRNLWHTTAPESLRIAIASVIAGGRVKFVRVCGRASTITNSCMRGLLLRSFKHFQWNDGPGEGPWLLWVAAATTTAATADRENRKTKPRG